MREVFCMNIHIENLTLLVVNNIVLKIIDCELCTTHYFDCLLVCQIHIIFEKSLISYVNVCPIIA